MFLSVFDAQTIPQIFGHTVPTNNFDQTITSTTTRSSNNSSNNNNIKQLEEDE